MGTTSSIGGQRLGQAQGTLSDHQPIPVSSFLLFTVPKTPGFRGVQLLLPSILWGLGFRPP